MKLNFSTFYKDLLDGHFPYGYLGAENLVQVWHSGTDKQGLQHQQHLAWDLPHAWATPTALAHSLIFLLPYTSICAKE